MGDEELPLSITGLESLIQNGFPNVVLRKVSTRSSNEEKYSSGHQAIEMLIETDFQLVKMKYLAQNYAVELYKNCMTVNWIFITDLSWISKASSES